MAETIIIDYLKYEINYGQAELVGFDKRKKEISYIRIPKSICYKNIEYPVTSVSRYCFGGLIGHILDVPNTLQNIGGNHVDLIPYTGHSETQNGVTMKVYEARENPPKKSWWERIFR